MAKSKQQKQLEAIERKRKEIDNWRIWYLDRQYGTQGYQEFLKKHGEEEANEEQKHRKRIFEKMCREAQVDTHGNPLPGSPGYNEPGLLMDKNPTIKMGRYLDDPAVIEQMKLSAKHLDPGTADGDFPKLTAVYEDDPVILDQVAKVGLAVEINRLREGAVLMRKTLHFPLERAIAWEQEADRLEKILNGNKE